MGANENWFTVQAKAKRRYVCGLKEVLKHLKLKKIKCVILPPNLDKIQSEGTSMPIGPWGKCSNCGMMLGVGGINDFVGEILALCKEQAVPVVFAMSRRRLAVMLRKKHQIGCVGIFLYDGAEVGLVLLS